MVAQAEESMAKLLAWAKRHCLEVKQVSFHTLSLLLATCCAVASCSLLRQPIVAEHMFMALQRQAAAVPAAVAQDNIVVMGQDEFHDALESAAESASNASTSSNRQPEPGQCACY